MGAPPGSEDILDLPTPKADARVAYGTDTNQFGDLRLPRGAGLFPIVLNLHGGFWRAKYDLVHAGHLCAALTERGIATWNVEYRRVGDDGGGWPGSLEDAASAWRFLPQLARRYPLDPSRVLVMGHSAGGQLAICMAAHEPSVTRVLSLAGLLDLHETYNLHLSHDAVVEFLGGAPTTVAEHYHEADPMELSIPKARQVVVQGTADEIVPPDFSRKYAGGKLQRGENVELVEVPKANHFDLIDPRSRAFPWVTASVANLLAA